MVDVLHINNLTDHIKLIVNRGPHTTEDEIFDAFRSLGVGDFKNADLYFGGADGNAGWERHPRETSWSKLSRARLRSTSSSKMISRHCNSPPAMC